MAVLPNPDFGSFSITNVHLINGTAVINSWLTNTHGEDAYTIRQTETKKSLTKK